LIEICYTIMTDAIPGPAAVPESPPTVADERRQSLVEAAFEAIAADGFEGLRTRSVAARAGVNIATLHYYFPTKEALIGGVAHYLASQFIALHGPAPASTGSDALDRLRQEFSDVRFYRAKHKALTSVMLEIQLRARRDPAIAAIVDPLVGHWRSGLERMVRAGQDAGVFRADLDAAAAALFLMAAFSGVTLHSLPAPALDRLFAEIERWLRGSAGTPGITKRGKARAGAKRRKPQE
jgi:TetR/AcrR family transcriptional regulator, regulator of cefoperazone and chloramphenicol sensitivity